MADRKDKIPAERRFYLRFAAAQIVGLYNASGKPDKAAEWKRGLDQ